MGRDRKNEKRGGKFAGLQLATLETPAWRSMTCTAQALYPWLLLEFKGARANNNGKIALSVRQAADRLGVGINTAARAFHELQAKGFIVVRQGAELGVKGQATCPAFEITELAMPGEVTGRRLFRDWKEGADYPVQKAAVHNPHGSKKKQNPVIKLVTGRHQIGDA